MLLTVGLLNAHRFHHHHHHFNCSTFATETLISVPIQTSTETQVSTSPTPSDILTGISDPQASSTPTLDPLTSPTPALDPLTSSTPALDPNSTPTSDSLTGVPLAIPSNLLSVLGDTNTICTWVQTICPSIPSTIQSPSPTPSPSVSSVPSSSPSVPVSTETAVYITFYGYTDNSCQTEAQHNCNDVAYPNIQPFTEENDGSYNMPNTLATDPTFITPGTIVYVPKFQKYYIMSDSCVECTTDYASGKLHVDLFIGPSTPPVHPNSLISCEDQLTTGGYSDTIIINPPSNLPVQTTVLYDDTTNVCL